MKRSLRNGKSIYEAIKVQVELVKDIEKGLEELKYGATNIPGVIDILERNLREEKAKLQGLEEVNYEIDMSLDVPSFMKSGGIIS